MIITWDGADYEYNELDIPTGMWVTMCEYAGVRGMLPWEQGVDAGDVKCLQGLYLAMLVQNGHPKVPLRSIDFGGSPAGFFIALRDAAQKEAVAKLEAEVAKAEADGVEYKEPDPTG